MPARREQEHQILVAVGNEIGDRNHQRQAEPDRRSRERKVSQSSAEILGFHDPGDARQDRHLAERPQLLRGAKRRVEPLGQHGRRHRRPRREQQPHQDEPRAVWHEWQLRGNGGIQDTELSPPLLRALRLAVTAHGLDVPGHGATGHPRGLSVVRGGLRLGAFIPSMIGKSKFKLQNGGELDLMKLDPVQFEAMLKDLGEVLVDVDDDEGKQVRIRCE